MPDTDHSKMGRSPYRVLVVFGSGAYINSMCPDFHEELNRLIGQYGKPISVELIEESPPDFSSTELFLPY